LLDQSKSLREEEEEEEGKEGGGGERKELEKANLI